jgi:hypothetical protein
MPSSVRESRCASWSVGVDVMQLAAAIALSVSYVGLTLAWGGLPPRLHVPWWALAPFIVTFAAGLISSLVAATLPTPWAADRVYEGVPRRVHLSWRTAFRIPCYLPMVVLVCYFYWSVRVHFEIRWMPALVAGLAAIVVAFVARSRLREYRLLRDGEWAMAVVDGRLVIDAADRIAYHFTTNRGVTVSGRGWDLGYRVAEGSSVPVFYQASDHDKRVLACSSWFEVD